MTAEEVFAYRKELELKIHGRDVPKPIKLWHQTGLTSKILETIKKLNYEKPMPIQSQALPIIMSGRDCIGVAKTGSGKTLTFVLPMLRHIKDQPPVEAGEGPIGLIMAPTRELVQQIHSDIKKFAKVVGVRCVPVYGGSDVAQQISELKRGTEVVVCTPGRMIDILCTSGGKITNLRRVTFLVMDEADRMFDMGFEPQITRIVQNTRPDRQTVLFSATFPRQVEVLARKVLNKPVEVQVGGRSVVNKDITQLVEVRPESDRFLRLLELLGEWYEKGKILVFVHSHDKCDYVFKKLLTHGYPCLSLHGAKDQTDRESTISDFKSGACNLLIATSIAARGLDVKELELVVNFGVPNHYEDYVHRVGRTGRAGRKGCAITFISEEDARYAPDLVKALELSEQVVPADLKAIADGFMAKVHQGLEQAHGTGYGGSGFKFNEEEDEVRKAAKKAQAKEYGFQEDKSDSDDDDDGIRKAGGDLSHQVALAQIAAIAAATKANTAASATSGVGYQLLANNGLPIPISGALDSLPVSLTSSVLQTAANDGSAAARAAALAAAMNLQHNLAKIRADAMPDNYQAELEINDFPFRNSQRDVRSYFRLDRSCLYHERHKVWSFGVLNSNAYFYCASLSPATASALEQPVGKDAMIPCPYSCASFDQEECKLAKLLEFLNAVAVYCFLCRVLIPRQNVLMGGTYDNRHNDDTADAKVVEENNHGDTEIFEGESGGTERMEGEEIEDSKGFRHGFSGIALVEFQKDMPGLHNALSFEKAYDADRHGKKHWLETANRDSELYGWIAQASDYNGKDIVGDNLQKIGDIRTIFDLMAEEAREKNRLVSNLNKVIEEKDMHLKEIQSRVTETSKALSIAMTERDKLNEELKKIQLGATEHFQKITNDHKIKKLKLQIETQMRNNEEQREELKKREARNESEMKKLLEEIEMNKSKNSSLELASLEHQRADASVYKLAEDQKRQKEELHKSIIQLEKQIDAKHALEVEITTLRGNLNVERQLATGGDVEKIKEVEEMMQVLRDAEEELDNAETLIQDLIVKARKSNDDVQDARKEFINIKAEDTRASILGFPLLRGKKGSSSSRDVFGSWETSCISPIKVVNQWKGINTNPKRKSQLRSRRIQKELRVTAIRKGAGKDTRKGIERSGIQKRGKSMKDIEKERKKYKSRDKEKDTEKESDKERDRNREREKEKEREWTKRKEKEHEREKRKRGKEREREKEKKLEREKKRHSDRDDDYSSSDNSEDERKDFDKKRRRKVDDGHSERSRTTKSSKHRESDDENVTINKSHDDSEKKDKLTSREEDLEEERAKNDMTVDTVINDDGADSMIVDSENRADEDVMQDGPSEIGTSEEDDIDPLDAFMNSMVLPEVEKLNSISTHGSSTGKKDQEKNGIKRNGEQPKRSTCRGIGRIIPGEDSDGDYGDFEDDGNKSEDEDDEEFMKRVKKTKAEKLTIVDHSKIDYPPFRNNFYIEVKEITRMAAEEVFAYRKELELKIHGRDVPKPIKIWHQTGLTSKILETIKKLNYEKPMPIQSQALPIIMSGRDCIGVAKTGSGKTLAFVLPMLRHIKDQPPVEAGEGPIGLIMAPTRELVQQIHSDIKKFAKVVGVRCVPVYGGSDVAQQISELKRGTEVVVCTPGRMIDILCTSGGKITNLRRVTFLVMDEADRMFDMGFEPQITRIVQNTRPDRQTVLFSATFPRQVEMVARKVLNKPVEVQVGGRSVLNKDITQLVEVRPESDRFLRLLELLAEWYEKGKILVFVHSHDKCDYVFKELLKHGYPCLSLHGAKDQTDRESTISDFKSNVCNLLIATSIAARGLDVKDLELVVNFGVPNHYEDYVHCVGRTGRAGRKGCAITFISEEDARYAPDLVKALELSEQVVPADLKAIADGFMAKVHQGLEQAHGTGYGGSGFKFNEEENEVRKAAKKAQAKEYGFQEDKSDSDDDDDGIRKSNTAASATSGMGNQLLANNGLPIPISGALSSLPVSLTSSVHQTGAYDGSASARAAALAAAMNLRHNLAKIQAEHYQAELEINDFLQNACWKVTHKETLGPISDWTGASITTRGLLQARLWSLKNPNSICLLKDLQRFQ
ncbi:unnamed protein product [Rhodiola kirilowii]